MTTTLLTPQPERFPSLVESVLARREQEWRAADLELERAGKPLRQRPAKRRSREEAQRLRLQVAEPHNRDISTYRIALMLDLPEKTVRDVLGRLEAAGQVARVRRAPGRPRKLIGGAQ